VAGHALAEQLLPAIAVFGKGGVGVFFLQGRDVGVGQGGELAVVGPGLFEQRAGLDGGIDGLPGSAGGVVGEARDATGGVGDRRLAVEPVVGVAGRVAVGVGGRGDLAGRGPGGAGGILGVYCMSIGSRSFSNTISLR